MLFKTITKLQGRTDSAVHVDYIGVVLHLYNRGASGFRFCDYYLGNLDF